MMKQLKYGTACLLLLAASLILWYRTPWETALGEGEKGKRTGRM